MLSREAKKRMQHNYNDMNVMIGAYKEEGVRLACKCVSN